MRLDQLPLNRPARVSAIAWADLAETAARRLRELGLDEGVTVEALHGRAVRQGPDRLSGGPDDRGAQARAGARDLGRSAGGLTER